MSRAPASTPGSTRRSRRSTAPRQQTSRPRVSSGCRASEAGTLSLRCRSSGSGGGPPRDDGRPLTWAFESAIRPCRDAEQGSWVAHVSLFLPNDATPLGTPPRSWWYVCGGCPAACSCAACAGGGCTLRLVGHQLVADAAQLLRGASAPLPRRSGRAGRPGPASAAPAMAFSCLPVASAPGLGSGRVRASAPGPGQLRRSLHQD